MRRQWLEFNVRPNIEIVNVGTFMISIFIGKDMDGKDQKLISSKNNRPSLIAGATGAGETVKKALPMRVRLCLLRM